MRHALIVILWAAAATMAIAALGLFVMKIAALGIGPSVGWAVLVGLATGAAVFYALAASTSRAFVQEEFERMKSQMGFDRDPWL